MTTKEDVVARLKHITQADSDGPAAVDNLMRVKRFTVDISTLAAGVAERTIMTAKYACEIISAEILPDNALTAGNVNYATLTLGKADGAGGAVTSFDAFTTQTAGTGGTDDWVQGVPEAFTIVPATDTLAVGEALILVTAKAGAGVAIEGTLEVEYRIL